jgi:hypothetical protein
VLELESLECDAVLEAVDAGDAVSDLEDGADLGQVGLDVELLDSILQDRGDLFGSELQGSLLLRNPRAQIPKGARFAAAVVISSIT